MEYNELKSMWAKYNSTLDEVAQTNRNVLKKMISQKSEKRLWIMKIQAILSILISPAILAAVIFPILISYETSPPLIAGGILIALVFGFYFIQSIQYYKLLNRIKPALDPVIKTKERTLELRKFVLSLQNKRYVVFPFAVGAIVLIIWENLSMDEPFKLIAMGAFFIAVFFWGRYKSKLYFHDRMKSFEVEMDEIQDMERNSDISQSA